MTPVRRAGSLGRRQRMGCRLRLSGGVTFKMESQRHIDQPTLHGVLLKVLPKLQAVLAETDYRLVGTAAALSYGCELPVGDVDFLMRDRKHVDAFSDALSEYHCLVKPRSEQWSPPPQEAGQYWCRYDIDGISVEASTVEVNTESDCIEVSGSGPWTHHVGMKVGMCVLPTVKIELRLATELSRNREDRYEPILGWMAKNGCDLSLLKRAMDARRVPVGLQQAVLLRLARHVL